MVSRPARREMQDSISWVNASRPVLAVTQGERPTASRGSTSTARGSRWTLRMLALIFRSGQASTALRVTSEPVPAVVGSAIIGTAGRASGSPSPTSSM